MAFYNLKCGAEFERCDADLMEQHFLSCQYCQRIVEEAARPSSVSIVDAPADLNCKTSDGHDWERDK